MSEHLETLLRTLLDAGGGTASIEVKSAAGGLPASLMPSLSALANLAGGGTIILGLNERAGFQPVTLSDPQALKQGLAAKARAFTPPVRLTIEDAQLDGHPLVVARVHECDQSAKPCRITATGAAYLRGYDGDFQLSDLETQGFLAARRLPLFERQPVDGATTDDLDPELVAGFIATVRERDRQGLGRFSDDGELLRRAGVTTPTGQPTVAGLLALGLYPQEYFPRFVIQAAAEPLPGDPPGARARNQATISGPIPRMLDSAMDWARRTFASTIVDNADGSVTDQPEYPLIAFREIITNALVHRDLDHWAQPFAIEVRLRRDRLVVTNPGGLYGITLDRLGHEAVTSARNPRLVAICQHLRAPECGSRIIEALASGIPTIATALSNRGLPAAKYVDTGIRFTALLQRPASRGVVPPVLNATESRVYQALTAGGRTVTDLAAEVALTPPTIRKALRSLRQHNLIQQIGGRGRATTYYLAHE